MMLYGGNSGRVRRKFKLLSLFFAPVTRVQKNILLHKDHLITHKS